MTVLIVDQMALRAGFDPTTFPLVLSVPSSLAKAEAECYFYLTNSMTTAICISGLRTVVDYPNRIETSGLGENVYVTRRTAQIKSFIQMR